MIRYYVNLSEEVVLNSKIWVVLNENCIYIYTKNVSVAKEMLVKSAIKAGMNYVEMENEIIIKYDYLFRIVPKEKVSARDTLIDVNMLKNFNMCDYYLDHYIDSDNISFKYQPDIPKVTKNDYKRESKKVNSMVKTKQQYNRRRYR